MHPAPSPPAPSRRGWSRGEPRGSTPGSSAGSRLGRWLRRVTAGTTTAAVVLLSAPAVTSGPVAGVPAGGSTGGSTADGSAAGAAPAAGDPVAVTDLRLVGHRKPHPHRTIKRYRVRPGDTPSGIAVRYHAWTAQLLRINHTSTLYAGDVIRVPVVTRAAQECTEHRHHRTNVGKHKPGKHDKHAAKAKAGKSKKSKAKPTKASTKKSANKDPDKQSSKKSAKKKASKPAKNKASSKKASKPKKATKRPGKKKARAPHHVRHAKGWHHRGATRAEVRRVIVTKAKRYGVNPALALAVAWQEAGWQHGLVSPSGAVGAMQIMPGTGQWMSTMVGRRLNTKDLYDNVTAGVVLLRWLRDEAGPRYAVAGYYQGLAGVRRYGMYDSTQRYVANVHALRKRIEKGWSPL